MKVQKSKDVIVYEEFDEVILINMMKNKFYSLDRMGTIVWKLVEKIGDISVIVSEISKEFKADPLIVKRDVEELIDELIKAEVVICNGEV